MVKILTIPSIARPLFLFLVFTCLAPALSAQVPPAPAGNSAFGACPPFRACRWEWECRPMPSRARPKEATAPARREIPPSLPALGLCLAAFVYLWIHVDTSLSYFAPTWTGLPFFATHARLAHELWSRPGGGAEWIAAGLSQLYRVPWAGALLLTTLGTLATAATAGYVRGLREGRVPLAVSFLPAAAMLYLVTVLGYQLQPMLSTTLTLAAAWLYVALARGGDGARAGLALALTSCSYWLIGGHVVALALLVALHEWAGRRRQPALVALLAGLAVPYLVGVRVLGLPSAGAFGGVLPNDYGGQAGFAGLAIAIGLSPMAVLLALVCAIGARHRKSPPPAEDPKARKRGRRAEHPRLRAALYALPWLALIGALTLGSLRHPRAEMRLQALTASGRWEAACRAGLRVPLSAYGPRTGIAVLLALYESGRLGDDAFRYPMAPLLYDGVTFGQSGVDLTGKAELGQFAEFRGGGIYPIGDSGLLLGLICEQEHRVQHSLVLRGPRPEILRSLVLLSIVKGRPEVAKAALRNLRHDVWHRGWAEHMLSVLETDPAASSEAEVERIRAAALRTDNIEMGLSIGARLEALLDDNPRNRMALEYLILYDLACLQPGRAIPHLPRLAEVGYTRLPRAFEEAVVLMEEQNGETIDLGGLTVSPEARQRFARFDAAYASLLPRGIQAAEEGLAAEYGGSYYYYAAFGRSASGGVWAR